MATTAFIIGSGLKNTVLLAGLAPAEVETRLGSAVVFRQGDYIFLPRHGHGSFVAPHLINYAANIAALHELGATRVISVNSVGSLREDVPPGTFVLPHDVFCLWRRDTFNDAAHNPFTIPVVDEPLRAFLAAAVARCGFPLEQHGVYCQTPGPSFETRAEIAFLRTVGDVVGMTLAQEVFLASELRLPIASLCMVDNFANGIAPERLTISSVTDTARTNLSKVERVIEEIMNGCE